MEGLSKEDQFLLKRLLEQVKGLRDLITEAQSTPQNVTQGADYQGEQDPSDEEAEMEPEELESAVEASIGAKALRQITLIHNSIKKVEARQMIANPNVQRLIKTAGEIEAQARSSITLELPRPRATGARRETIANELTDNIRKLDALLAEYPSAAENAAVIRAKANATLCLSAPEQCRQESTTVKYVKQQMREIKSVQQEFDKMVYAQSQELKKQLQPTQQPTAPNVIQTHESIYPKL